MTKTKIVCTIGPACWDEKTLKEMIKEGMDVCRLNFSHGDHETHKENFNKIRRLSQELNQPIAILQDLCGPKIRLGELKGEIELIEGETVTLTSKETENNSERLFVSYPHLEEDIKPDEMILIDDGLVQLKAIKNQPQGILCQILVGGKVTSHKGVNLPQSHLRISALSEKDLEDVRLGIELGVDFIALSFVRRPEDILHLKQILAESKKFIPIIAKIEKKEAVNNLEDILNVAEGAMVARGDLGIEIPIENVPIIQKKIIHMCNKLSKPVITATQMLDSMIRNPIPTRAEVTDVANAILDGTDAIMLSGETANGKYPLQALKTMDKIAKATEELIYKKKKTPTFSCDNNVVNSISLSTYHIAEELNAKAILIMTDSGRTAQLVSRYKPRVPILGITYTETTQRRLKLSWGVIPLIVEEASNTDKMLDNGMKAALESGFVKNGDLVISTAGIPALVKGSTNMIKVDIIGNIFKRGIGVGKKTNVTGKVCIAENAQSALTKLDQGDILITARLDDSFVPLANRLGGVITEEGNVGSYGEFFCEKFQIPGLLAVPGAREAFYEGRIVTLDVQRGIVFTEKT